MQAFLSKARLPFTRRWLAIKQWYRRYFSTKLSKHHELDLLRKNMETAHTWLQKISLPQENKTIFAKHLPTYLLLGTSNTGKTALLSYSQLSFTHTAQLVQQNLTQLEPSRHCNWWVNQAAITIDVPGRYFDDQDSVAHSTNWHYLLKNLQLPLAGIIIAVSIETCLLQNQVEWQQFCAQLRQKIHDIARQFSQRLTITFCFTKVDLLKGFSEFFADLGVEEQAQAFGINFLTISVTEQTHLLDAFNAEFAKLLQRLHERALWRLQQERNLQKRNLIQNFPLQLESLKNPLTDLFQAVTEIIHYYPNLQIQGCYFCSSLHAGTPHDNLLKTLQQNFDFPRLHYHESLPKNQPYFLTQFWQQLWSSANHLPLAATLAQRYKKYFLYGSAIVSITAAAMFGTYHYQQQMQAITKATQAISTYQTLINQNGVSNVSLADLLPKLNALRDSVIALQQADLTWLSRWFTPDQANTLQLANNVYQRALEQQFLPAVVTDLQQRLNNDTGIEPDVLYGNFKAYLMFGTPSKWQANYLETWLPQQWNQDNRSVLLQHLRQALKHTPVSITLDLGTINQTRSKLWQTANLANLGYAVLKNQTFAKTFNPWRVLSNNPLKFQLEHSALANFYLRYNRDYFINNYAQDLIQATNAVTQGDWILGAKPPELQVAQVEMVRLAIKQAYLNDYVTYWQTCINQLAAFDFTQKTDLRTFLAALTTKKSFLLEIANLINYHSQVLLSANLDRQQLQIFIALQDFASPDHIADYRDLNNNLLQLRNYLDKIDRNDSAAFVATRQRFKGAADPITLVYQQVAGLPQPFKNWLTQLADDSWQQLLAQTLHYLNKIWQNTVLPVYKTAITGRYPLSKSANMDINPTEFSRFFGPNGLLENYVKTYLLPFLNTQSTRWQPLTLNKLGLPLNAAAIAQLERATIIRTMYFHDAAQLATTFDLTAEPIDKNLSQTKIGFNQQLLIVHPNAQASRPFIWSADTAGTSAIVQLIDDHNKTIELTSEGPWSWFKLLDKGELQPLEDTRNYQLLFHLHGYTLRYRLTAQNLLNPFIPQALEDFRCPASLG